MTDPRAAGGVIPGAQYPSLKAEPVEATGEVCLDTLLAALTSAESIGQAIALVVDAVPEWSTGRCTRFARQMWNHRDELDERSRTYALLKAAASDGPFRRRTEPAPLRAGVDRDPTADRAAHNVGVVA